MNKRYLYIQEKFKRVEKIARKAKRLKENEELLESKKKVVPIKEPVGLTYFDEYKIYEENYDEQCPEENYDGRCIEEFDENEIVLNTVEIKIETEINSGVPP